MTFRQMPQALLTALLLISSSNQVRSEEASGSISAESHQQLQQEILRLQDANKVRDLVIKNLIRRIEQLEHPAANQSEPANAAADQLAQSSQSAETQQQMQQQAEENYQLVQKAFEQRLVKQNGMLLAPFNMTYEPSFSYAHASYDSIVIDGFTIFPVLVIGDIVSEKIRRDIFTNNHTFRLGLPWDTQLDLVVPLGYQRTRSFREDGSHESHEEEGVGDISLGLSYQLVRNSDRFPDTVLGINWKSKNGDDPYDPENAEIPVLGSGFETLALSMTSMSIADPIVIFGGLSASHTLGETKALGRIQPGDSLGLNLGMALSLNFDTSLSFNYGIHYTGETKINGQKIYGSDLIKSTFGIGLSRAENGFYATDIDLAIGLTRDATDFQLTVSFPFEFSLSDM